MAPSQPDRGLPYGAKVSARGVLDWSAMSARERIASARLYLVCDARPRAFLEAALRGGVDMIQLRDKALGDDALIDAGARVPRRGRRAPARCSSSTTGPTSSRPAAPTACTSARTTAASRDARAAVGPDRIVGRSTHAPEQGAAADADPDVDYLAVGPVHATPTKPGRPAAGLEYVEWAAANVTKPWFAIGGLDAGNVGAVVARGATPRSSSCARSPTAADPEAAARALRERLEAPVGAAQP